MVQQRGGAREPLLTHELLGQAPVRPLVERVALDREIASLQVLRHHRSYRPVSSYRFPRRACSSSMASNSALKFPSPNPRAPSRWMTSTKTVGRSASVSVNT